MTVTVSSITGRLAVVEGVRTIYTFPGNEYILPTAYVEGREKRGDYGEVGLGPGRWWFHAAAVVRALIVLLAVLTLGTRHAHAQVAPGCNPYTDPNGCQPTTITQLTWAEGVIGAPGREYAWLDVAPLAHEGGQILVIYAVDTADGPMEVTRQYLMPTIGRVSIPVHAVDDPLFLRPGIKTYRVTVTCFTRCTGTLVQRNADPTQFWRDADYLLPSDKTETSRYALP